MSRVRKNPGDFTGRPVWAEISLSALARNLQAIRDYVNPASEKRKTPRKVLCIVKGNAYGHGGAQTAKALERFGADWFGVASSVEGAEIRKIGVRTPVLVLGGFWPGEEKILLEHKLTPAIHRCEQLLSFEAAAAKLHKRNASIQLKIDTGMNRLGLRPEDMDCFARQLAKCPHLSLTGTFTHFASSEVLCDLRPGAQTRQQLERFHVAIERLRALRVDPGILHLANSAAIAALPETWGDMVRPGAVLYGYHPGFDPAELRTKFEAALRLQPVMSLRTRIINVRSIAAGESVGYSSSWTAQRPSRIAVLAAGYGDGIHRSLGNKGSVVIRGQRAPMLGIISMDVTMVDVTDIPDATVGDIATVYGTVGQQEYPANVVARSISTVTSDLLSGVSQRVPRFYVE
jgi:alanine racemase